MTTTWCRRELRRIVSPKWKARHARTRWEFVCTAVDQGRTWQELAVWFGRSESTIQRLWRRGWLERQKKVIVCAKCSGQLDAAYHNLPYPRYPRKTPDRFSVRDGNRWTSYRSQPASVIQLHGFCVACGCVKSAKLLKLNSLEQASEESTVVVDTQRWQPLDEDD